MATTTTNYGFDIPQSTDLVKDGATAIATLGQDIDTAMNTALGTKKAGMVLLNTTSFSAVSSISLPQDTFTSTYDIYRIIFYGTATSSSGTVYSLRLRAAGVDATAANYQQMSTGINRSGSADNNAQFGTTSLSIIGVSGSLGFVFDIIGPKATRVTTLNGAFAVDNSSTYVARNFNALHDLTTSYDSLSIFPAAGTITGKVQVYGYNQ
jgi:hypothetical protein